MSRKRVQRHLGFALLVSSFLLSAIPAYGYTPKPAPNPEQPKPEGPHYFNLRYDEDYSFLEENPEAREQHWHLKLKHLDLGGTWRLDVGGEFRMRGEFRSNQTFGLDPRTSNAQQNYRWMLHANLKYEDWFRLFVQGVFTHVEDQDGPFQPTQENHGDIHQLFADFRIFGPEEPYTLRVGRQEFSYGNDRLIGPLDWVSNRRSFDAVKFMYHGELFNIDAFYARPLTIKRTQLDSWRDDYHLYGLYATYKGIENHGIDAYLIVADQDVPTRSPNRKDGDLLIYTAGMRFWGYSGGWDYDTELAGQWGRWADDAVAAYMWEIDGGYTFDLPWKPRLGGGFSYTTGDHNPYDGKVNTFNQLFTFNDVCIGILDLIGRQNLTRAYVNLDFWPVEDKLLVATYLHRYWLSAAEDNYYNAGAVPVLRDLDGSSGVELGTELDLWVEYFLTPSSSVVFGYAYFWDDNYVHQRVGTVTGSDDPNLFLLQFRYRF